LLEKLLNTVPAATALVLPCGTTEMDAPEKSLNVDTMPVIDPKVVSGDES
jgi:hypothetical protein